MIIIIFQIKFGHCSIGHLMPKSKHVITKYTYDKHNCVDVKFHYNIPVKYYGMYLTLTASISENFINPLLCIYQLSN